MTTHTHILGICGTFMGGVAQLARELGHEVSGSDQGIYPPMSEQLQRSGIVLTPGFDAAQLDGLFSDEDSASSAHEGVEVVIGNALTRGQPVIERLLREKRELVSGPQWLYRHVLRNRQVLAVAGTHGKTTTSSMLAWILEHAGLQPGFLIGGVPGNFGISARLGHGPFVIEADEYDSAFFDKRSKFVHYRPDVLILNNLEFDHADIFRDLADIQRQFHHVVRTVPEQGVILAAAPEPALDAVLKMGCWSELQRFGAREHCDSDNAQQGTSALQWRVSLNAVDASSFTVHAPDGRSCLVQWSLIGQHNALNALAAISAAYTVGVSVKSACEALAQFVAPRRRMELRGDIGGVRVYDDFAHHPSAVRASLQALRASVGDARIIAVLDPASNTMRMGVHRDTLAPALADADRVLLHRPQSLNFALEEVAANVQAPCSIHNTVENLIDDLCAESVAGDHVLIMSNGGFGGIHDAFMQRLSSAVDGSKTSTPTALPGEPA